MEPGKVYHIYNRGNNKERIFLKRENYLFFLQKYKYYLRDYIDTYAYCLMPNHFHFLIKVKTDDVNQKEDYTGKALKNFLTSPAKLSPLEKAFRDFFISYAKSFNKENGRTGSLFQYKFKRKPVEDDSYYSSIVSYIHLNPVKAGLSAKPEDWEFSSYKAYISSGTSSIKKEEALEWFGGIERFKSFHQSELAVNIEKYLFD